MISVIVPVYNTSENLERCLNSILNNDYKQIEIICVDDGSTDDSLKILNKFKELDNRIKVYSKANGGVSSARNFGLKKVTGEYICFVDSDDEITSDYFSHFIHIYEHYDVDLVISSIREVDLSKNIIREKILDRKIFNKTECINSLFETTSGSLCNKCFLSEIILKNKLTFDSDIHYCEDLLFVSSYVMFTNKTYVSDRITYQYYFVSRIDKYSEEKLLTRLSAIDKLICLFEQYDNLKELSNNLKAEYMIRYNQLDKSKIAYKLKVPKTYIFSLIVCKKYSFKIKLKNLAKFILKN